VRKRGREGGREGKTYLQDGTDGRGEGKARAETVGRKGEGVLVLLLPDLKEGGREGGREGGEGRLKLNMESGNSITTTQPRFRLPPPSLPLPLPPYLFPHVLLPF